MEEGRLATRINQPPSASILLPSISSNAKKDPMQDAPLAHKLNTETEACFTEEIK